MNGIIVYGIFIILILKQVNLLGSVSLRETMGKEKKIFLERKKMEREKITHFSL